MTCRTRLMLQPSEMYMILGVWSKVVGCKEVFDYRNTSLPSLHASLGKTLS